MHLEVKRVEKLNLRSAIAQAGADARETEIPVVVHRWNGGPWLAILPLVDLLPLLKKKNRGERPVLRGG